MSLALSDCSDADLAALRAQREETGADMPVPREKIVRLVEDRLLARHQKNWAESDRIRDELATMGIQIKDNKDGTTSWEIKR